MITEIAVDGYRSLTAFDMEVVSGPNILIGPNGSGKSNIIGFFQFLSRILNYTVADAVSLSGGAGSFFTKKGQTEYKREFSARVSGFTFVDQAPWHSDKGTILYDYEFTIKASEKFDQIIFGRQTIKLYKMSEENCIPPERIFDRQDWDLILNADEENSYHIGLEFWNVGKISSVRSKTESKDDIQKILDEEYGSRNIASTTSLLRTTPWIPALNNVGTDLTGGETININPSEVKKPEDSSKTPGIQSDGSGLAATLWHLQQEGGSLHRMWPYFMPSRHNLSHPESGWKAIHGQIQSLIKLVNPQIRSVIVRNDPYDNQLKIRVVMVGLGSDVELPLSAMSDGSIKWAALITAVLTHRAIFAIEEPENFLHPLMQAEVIKIMRETTSRKNSSVIMTTHSETLLNFSDPQELIVVSMKDGVTHARRIKDPSSLRNEISETGFGLGNYYLAGDLMDA